MSGIAGIFYLNGDGVSDAQLWSMAIPMKRRGPDYQNVMLQGNAGMAFAGLNTTPEASFEKQPVNIGNLSIVVDARIDNRDELYHSFELAGLRINPEAGDAEYILNAYRLWKDDCPNYLLGAFSFGIWDNTTQQVFCARDHLGVKPLVYYHNQGEVFAWASDISSLLALDCVPNRLNDARIADYLVHQLEGRNHEITLYQEIHRLTAAHTIRVESDQFRITRYWKLKPQPELVLSSDEAYVEAFLEKFEKAIHRRLRAESPDQVGVMLSGGIDSGAVAGIARNYLMKTYNKPIKTFSAVSIHGKDDDETKHCMAIIEQDGYDATTIRSDELINYLPELRYIIENHTNLFANIMEIPHLTYVSASQNGVKVMLDGVGGDNVIDYSPWLITTLLRRGHVKNAIREAKQYGTFYDGDYFPFRSVMRSALIGAFVPQFLKRLRRKLRGDSSLRQTIADSFINLQFSEEQNLLYHLKELYQSRSVTEYSNPSAIWAMGLQQPYIPVALERYNDVSSSHGIEARPVYFDRELIEFCLSLPINQHIRGGWTKYILRKALEGILPDSVCWRRGKASLSHEFGKARYLLEKPWIIQQIDEGQHLIEPYVETIRFNETILKPFINYGNISYGEIWTIATLVSYLNMKKHNDED
jgi:asparagine synthase (glutamine-hydrolysing)